MVQRLHAQDGFQGGIQVVLNDAVALHGAEFGNVQLATDDYLVIVAQRGFRTSFLNAFRRIHADTGTSCGRALREKRTVVIRDLQRDKGYAAYRPIVKAAGCRSVTSTPLLTSNNVVIGVVSTAFVNVHEPTSIEIKTLDSYGKVAADHLHNLLADEPLKQTALVISERLYQSVSRAGLSK
jgi:GAF domain-containing protein